MIFNVVGACVSVQDRMGYHLLFGVGAACSASFVLFIWFLVVAVERQSSQAPRKNKDV